MRVCELLEQVPLGYQPQSEPVDLVWEKQSAQALGQTPTQASQGDKVAALRFRAGQHATLHPIRHCMSEHVEGL